MTLLNDRETYNPRSDGQRINLLVDKLRQQHRLEADEYRAILSYEEEKVYLPYEEKQIHSSCESNKMFPFHEQDLSCEEVNPLTYLQKQAQEVALRQFGNRIFIRGLIEINNHCRNNCYYCGIRKSNTSVIRYELSQEDILACCREGYMLGFRTFVLQGGESASVKDEWITATVTSIRREFPDCAIALSLGEKSREAYAHFFHAGANRYLLRHETADEAHYCQLHPKEMSFSHRMQCLQWLKEIGYQVGTGIMVGSPGQTIDHLVEDILFIEQFRPEMIGIGPFIPHHDTPFASYSPGNIQMTLKLLSIFRLMHPAALIPSTTALATLAKDGRELGILAGANVVMPNLSPKEQREKYSLYDNKASMGAEAVEGLKILENKLKAIGYEISKIRGDYKDRVITNIPSAQQNSKL